MNWNLNTGIVLSARTHSSIIRTSLQHTSIPDKWTSIRTANQNAKICYSSNGPYLAIRLKGKWRLLGHITNSAVINKYLQGPLIQFHQAWSVGILIDEPKIS